MLRLFLSSSAKASDEERKLGSPWPLTSVQEIFQCHPAPLLVWLGAACPPVNWGHGSPASSHRPWWDTLPPPLPPAPIVFIQGTHQPPLVLCQPGTPMLTLTVSSFELWGPSSPTQLSPTPSYLPRFTQPTIPVSDILPHPLSLPVGIHFPQGSNPPGVVLAAWSDLLPNEWLHLGWRSSKPSGKG